MRNTERVGRNARREGFAETCVAFAGVGVIVVCIFLLVKVLIDEASPPGGRWNADDWAAYGQMLTAVISAVGLGGILYGVYYQRRQLLEARENFARALADRDPDFHGSGISVGYDWYGSPDGRPTSFSYAIRVRNSGGPAHSVRVCLLGTAGHLHARRGYAHHDIAEIPAQSEASPVMLYRQIADSHRPSFKPEDSAQELRGVGWFCGPLVIEYVNRRGETHRVRFRFADTSPYPTPIGLEKALMQDLDERVTAETVPFIELMRDAYARARTDYVEPGHS